MRGTSVGRRGFDLPCGGLDGADLGGVAPGAEEAFEAEGADSDPNEGAGWEVLQVGFAACGVAGAGPVFLPIGVAEAGLYFVHGTAVGGMVAGFDGAAECAVAQHEILDGGGL